MIVEVTETDAVYNGVIHYIPGMVDKEISRSRAIHRKRRLRTVLQSCKRLLEIASDVLSPQVS